MSNQATYLFDRSRVQGRLMLTDRDRLDLLHRMSTNDFEHIEQGEWRSTVLTTALARIIDRVVVYNQGEAALMITNQPTTVRNWLQRHIFFQDKVRLRDVSAEIGQLELHGPLAGNAVERIVPGARDLPSHRFVEAQLFEHDQAALVAKTFPLTDADDSYLIIGSMGTIGNLIATFSENGTVQIGDDVRYEQMRIQAGLPGTGHELTEDFIPLEANLWDSVSFTKGCYIGQEIIARMESRNRLAKTLVKLHLSAVVPVGADLMDEDRKVGSVTSVASIENGNVIGIGFVKPDRAEEGVRLTVATDDQAQSGEVVTAEIALPLQTQHTHRQTQP